MTATENSRNVSGGAGNFLEVCIIVRVEFNTHFEVGGRLLVLARAGLDDLSLNPAKHVAIREGKIEKYLFPHGHAYA